MMSAGSRPVGILGKIIESDAYLVERILNDNDQMAAHDLIERHYKKVYKAYICVLMMRSWRRI